MAESTEHLQRLVKGFGRILERLKLKVNVKKNIFLVEGMERPRVEIGIIAEM